MRHPIDQDGRAKTSINYRAIQSRRQIEWNLSKIRSKPRARARVRAIHFVQIKKKWAEGGVVRTRVFFRRRLAPRLFSRKRKRGRSSWRRLSCQQRRKLRKTFCIGDVLRVRVWGFFSSYLSFYARIPTRDGSKKRDLDGALLVEGWNKRTSNFFLFFFVLSVRGGPKKGGRRGKRQKRINR